MPSEGGPPYRGDPAQRPDRAGRADGAEEDSSHACAPDPAQVTRTLRHAEGQDLVRRNVSALVDARACRWRKSRSWPDTPACGRPRWSTAGSCGRWSRPGRG